MTKQLLQKEVSHKQPLDNVTLNSASKEDSNYIKEASDMSENSVKELKVKFYLSTTNEKEKTYKKSRRCVV